MRLRDWRAWEGPDSACRMTFGLVERRGGLALIRGLPAMPALQAKLSWPAVLAALAIVALVETRRVTPDAAGLPYCAVSRQLGMRRLSGCAT